MVQTTGLRRRQFFFNGLSISPSVKVNVFHLLQLLASAASSTGRVHVLGVIKYIIHSDGRCVSLENILQFFSGASKLPATGFDETKISFTSEDVLPYTSACALKIMFPRSLGVLSYDDFEGKMDFCVCCSFGFVAI